MILSDRVLKSCDEHAARTALVEGDRSVDYATLATEVRRFAGGLIEKGGRRRETVALLVPNSIEFVSAYFGTLAAGKTALPLNPALGVEELAYILEDASVETLVVARALEPKARLLGEMCPGLRFLIPAELPETGPEGAGFAQADDVATLLYTSGTTGKPKGVMLTHRNLVANVSGCLQVLSVRPQDRFLAVLPFFHAFGITGSLAIPLAAGSSVEIATSLAPSRLLQVLRDHEITHLLAVPSVFGLLARAAPEAPRHSLRLAVAGGEPLPERIYLAWQARFGIPLCQGYGTTETAPVISLMPGNDAADARRAGRPLPNLEVRVIIDDAAAVAGQVGEVQVRGPSVMRGYLNRPEDTAEVLDAAGWYRTGDLGTLDDEGYLTITGRIKDLIISAGENIYPAEIEEVLRAIPGVSEAAVVGVPDPSRGEVPKAYICVEEGRNLEATEIRDTLRERLADYKVPRFYEILRELPRNATGKVQKAALRESAARQRA